MNLLGLFSDIFIVPQWYLHQKNNVQKLLASSYTYYAVNLGAQLITKTSFFRFGFFV